MKHKWLQSYITFYTASYCFLVDHYTYIIISVSKVTFTFLCVNLYLLLLVSKLHKYLIDKSSILTKLYHTNAVTFIRISLYVFCNYTYYVAMYVSFNN